jgi:hypothetical protein
MPAHSAKPHERRAVQWAVIIFPHFSKNLVLTDENGAVIYAAQIEGQGNAPGSDELGR